MATNTEAIIKNTVFCIWPVLGNGAVKAFHGKRYWHNRGHCFLCNLCWGKIMRDNWTNQSWVQQRPKPRMTVLVSASSHLPDQTRQKPVGWKLKVSQWLALF
jgi:hypothetical protein